MKANQRELPSIKDNDQRHCENPETSVTASINKERFRLEKMADPDNQSRRLEGDVKSTERKTSVLENRQLENAGHKSDHRECSESSSEDKSEVGLEEDDQSSQLEACALKQVDKERTIDKKQKEKSDKFLPEDLSEHLLPINTLSSQAITSSSVEQREEVEEVDVEEEEDDDDDEGRDSTSTSLHVQNESITNENSQMELQQSQKSGAEGISCASTESSLYARHDNQESVAEPVPISESTNKSMSVQSTSMRVDAILNSPVHITSTSNRKEQQLRSKAPEEEESLPTAPSKHTELEG